MRIRILSDLHREFGPADNPGMDVDLILPGGDISTKQNALPWIREFCGDTPTAYLCGNHEFYGDKLPRVSERLIEATRGTNVHVLEDDHFSVHGWHIYGCTLWTDMNLQGDWRDGAVLAAECMNDYKRIRNSSRGYKRLTPLDTRLIHLRSVELLGQFLETHDPRRTIVVTHHAPSALSLPESQRDKTISCAYASHLDHFIERHQPFLWVHGHIHHNSDYRIGATRILANPRGYPDFPNSNFDPALVIEV